MTKNPKKKLRNKTVFEIIQERYPEILTLRNYSKKSLQNLEKSF